MANKINYQKTPLSSMCNPKNVPELLFYFLNTKNSTYSFDKQTTLITNIQIFCHSNNIINEKLLKSLTQPNISKALKLIEKVSFYKGNKNYMLIKAKKCYKFVAMEVALKPLFDLNDIYLKDSLHAISDNTFVFCIPQDKHQIFLDTLNENFSKDLLWDYSSQGNHLVLMFNSATDVQKGNCEVFKNFFETKRNYEGAKPISLIISTEIATNSSDNNS